MIVECFPFFEYMSYGVKQTLGSRDKIRDRVNKLFVIAGLVAFDWRADRRNDIVGSAVSRQKDFDARACCFRCLDEDEFMFVRNNHRVTLRAIHNLYGAGLPFLLRTFADGLNAIE